MPPQLARENHSIPEAYLKGWAAEPGKVYSYRLLVPRDGYPVWKLRSTASLTRYTDLYTSSYSGNDSDWFERWLNENVEQPAMEPLTKVRSDQPLERDDWRRLAKYAASLDLRTPASYLEQASRWARTVPEILRTTMADVEAKVLPAVKSGNLNLSPRDHAAIEHFPMRVTLEKGQDGQAVLRAEIVAGRQLWIWHQRHMLSTWADGLARHQWVILHPYPGSEWFTSDHPMIRLNFQGHDDYNFGGGWAQPGTALILPLSPRHLMYAQIGSEWQGSTTCTIDQTFLLQQVIAERAHRWIFARGQPQRAVWFRPRRVDLSLFRTEYEAGKAWHVVQRGAETGPARELSSGDVG
jgi:hypothetical protein